MKQLLFRLSLIVAFFLSTGVLSNSQPFVQPIPDTYRKGTISEQLNQLEAHTRIYENFRAVREDVFQTISKNVKDTLASTHKKINNLVAEIGILNGRIDSINKSLESTKNNLKEMTQKQSSISVLGLNVNKTAYNSVMWSIVGIAILLLLIGYLIFKRNNASTVKAKTELSNLQKEFEEYKQKKRIELETMTMTHFNEIKKLKNELSTKK